MAGDWAGCTWNQGRPFEVGAVSASLLSQGYLCSLKVKMGDPVGFQCLCELGGQPPHSEMTLSFVDVTL